MERQEETISWNEMIYPDMEAIARRDAFLSEENGKKLEEKFVDAMVDLWVKDDAPDWVKKMVKEELQKQRQTENLNERSET